MLPHSEASSNNFSLLFPCVESVFIQGSGAHLVLQGNYTLRKLFHGREETQACHTSMSSIRDMEKDKDQLDLSGLS